MSLNKPPSTARELLDAERNPPPAARNHAFEAKTSYNLALSVGGLTNQEVAAIAPDTLRAAMHQEQCLRSIAASLISITEALGAIQTEISAIPGVEDTDD